MFERFAHARRRDWKRRALLAGSLVLHGAVAAALLVGGWFHVAELTPPLLSVVFWSAPPPTAPAERAPSRPHATHHPKPAAHALVAPTAPQPQPPANDLPDGPPSTDPPGPPGPPGPPCVGASCSTAAPCAGPGCVSAPAPKPHIVPPHALDSQRIAGAIPHLPAAVIDAHRGLGDSRFVARMCVDTSGAVSSVTVLAGIPGADADIVATLRGWRYKPQPIPVCFVTELLYDVQ